MAFTGNFTTNTFLVGLLDGTFDFGTGTTQVYKIALYTNAATLDATTTAYTSTGEATGGNYSPSGSLLTVSQVPTTGNQTGAATTTGEAAAETKACGRRESGRERRHVHVRERKAVEAARSVSKWWRRRGGRQSHSVPVEARLAQS